MTRPDAWQVQILQLAVLEDLEETTMVATQEGIIIREIHTTAEMVTQAEKRSIRNRDVSEVDHHSHLTCSWNRTLTASNFLREYGHSGQSAANAVF